MLYLKLVICLLLIAITSQSNAVESTEDVVYLKDGSIIRGQIIEQVLGDYVRIQTMGGSIFVFKASEIRTIKNEPRMSFAKKKNPILAATMSVLIPGLGQFYNEDYDEGISNFILFAVGVLFVRAGAEDDIYFQNLGRLDVDDDDWKTCLGAGLWAHAILDSAEDAYTSAKQSNERNQVRTRLRVSPAIASQKYIGAKLTFSF